MFAPLSILYGVGRVGDVPASPDIVGMQDIKADDVGAVNGDAAGGLLGKKGRRRFHRKKVLLRERDTLSDDAIPDFSHCAYIIMPVLPDGDSHYKVILSVFY
jgi:hypothetical protein